MAYALSTCSGAASARCATGPLRGRHRRTTLNRSSPEPRVAALGLRREPHRRVLALLPILRMPSAVGHRDDQNALGINAVDDAVRITLQQMEAVAVVTKRAAAGRVGDLAQGSLDGPLESRRRSRAAFGV